MPPKHQIPKTEEIIIQEIIEGPIGTDQGPRKRRKSIHSPKRKIDSKQNNIQSPKQNTTRPRMNSVNASPKVSKINTPNGVGSRGMLVVGK
jgi:hypothetical protein